MKGLKHTKLCTLFVVVDINKQKFVFASLSHSVYFYCVNHYFAHFLFLLFCCDIKKHNYVFASLSHSVYFHFIIHN